MFDRDIYTGARLHWLIAPYTAVQFLCHFDQAAFSKSCLMQQATHLPPCATFSCAIFLYPSPPFSSHRLDFLHHSNKSQLKSFPPPLPPQPLPLQPGPLVIPLHHLILSDIVLSA